MKIFVLTSGLAKFSGWGRYSSDLINALSESGVETVVSVEDSEDNKVFKGAIKILPKPSNYFAIYILAPIYALRLYRHAKKCDLIHSFIEPYSYIAFWLSKLTGKKYLITTHGTHGLLPYRLSATKRYFHRKSFQSAEINICVSNYTKKVLSKFGLSNLTVINNGINLKSFPRTKILPFIERDNIMLTVGAIKKRKGQHIAVQAFAKIASKHKDLKYYIVGDDSDTPYVAKLKYLISELNIKDRVVFLKAIPEDELHHLYQKAKVFVLTSLSKKSYFEGFGLVYIEANAFGLPVIGSLDSGAEDAILNQKTGYLVDQGDIDKTALNMDTLLSDEVKWSEMSIESTLWAAKHDWMDIVDEYVRIYRLNI